jgi:hypothetical protein
MVPIILSLFVVVVLVVVVTPLTVTAEFTVSEVGCNGALRMQWLHPLFARCRFDIGQRQLDATILGWRHSFTRKNTCTKQPSTSHTGNRERPVPPTDAAPLARQQNAADKGEKLHMKQRVTGRGTPAGSTGGWHRVRTFFLIATDYRVTAKALRWGQRTLRACFSVLRFHCFRLHAKAGTHDPAETGKLYGWYAALDRSCFSRNTNIDVRFEPDFSGEAFECSGDIAVRSSFARVGMPLVVALMTFPYLTAYFVWRRLRNSHRPD